MDIYIVLQEWAKDGCRGSNILSVCKTRKEAKKVLNFCLDNDMAAHPKWEYIEIDGGYVKTKDKWCMTDNYSQVTIWRREVE